MRCVFDTNVLVSSLLLPESTPRRALERPRYEGEVLLSYAVLAELSEVLRRKRFSRYVDEVDIRRFLATLTLGTSWVDVTVEIHAYRDSKDDKFLELAVSGDATHIVSGDADLLVLHPFRGIQILTPQVFLTA